MYVLYNAITYTAEQHSCSRISFPYHFNNVENLWGLESARQKAGGPGERLAVRDVAEKTAYDTLRCVARGPGANLIGIEQVNKQRAEMGIVT